MIILEFWIKFYLYSQYLITSSWSTLLHLHPKFHFYSFCHYPFSHHTMFNISIYLISLTFPIFELNQISNLKMHLLINIFIFYLQFLPLFKKCILYMYIGSFILIKLNYLISLIIAPKFDYDFIKIFCFNLNKITS